MGLCFLCEKYDFFPPLIENNWGNITHKMLYNVRNLYNMTHIFVLLKLHNIL